jgi:hypothetical protein
MTKAWGPSTWYLFHTLAEKIKEEHFHENKQLLLDLIIRICSNLPCPDCQGHAKQQMAMLKSNNIKTKEDLKSMLHSFHNIVNKRLNKHEMGKDELNNKYSLANTKSIVNFFIQTWGKSSHNPRLMAEDLHKKRLVTDFVIWWNKYNYIFE